MKNNGKIDKIRNIASIAVFMLLIAGLLIANLIMPDAEISKSERRKLTQFPTVTPEAIFSSEYSSDFEEYALDQFVLRDGWRTLKAITHFYALGQTDNNGIYIADGTVSKLEYPLKEEQVSYGVNKINTVNSSLFEDKNIYYSVVPDKNYYIADKNGYPAVDYDRLTSMLREGVNDGTYIDLFGALGAGDYYVTDTHWKQPNLQGVVDSLSSAMDVVLPALTEYDAHTLSPFYGVYYGQSALPLAPDKIVYLTNAATEASTVFNLEKNSDESVYTLDRFTGSDSYDIFLSGAAAFEVITNPLYEGKRTLVLFRDSFGSSLTPLLISGYSTIYVVDLRYMPSSILSSYIDTDSVDDVLWMYSALILNSASMLR